MSGSREIEAVKQRLATAKRWSDSAVEMLNTAQVEEAKAESFLKEVEERWHVIDLDSDCDSYESGGKENDATTQSAETSSSAASGSDDSLVGKGVVVEGAGIPEVNGAYKRCQSCDDDDFPGSFNIDLPVYSKLGSWEGKTVKFFIFRSELTRRWGLSCQTDTGIVLFYFSRSIGAKLPSQSNEWLLFSRGILPAPQLRHH